MTKEEFNKKFARLEKAHEKIMAKMNAIDFNHSDDIDDEFMDLMDDASDSIDKMCALVDRAFDEVNNEDSSDTEENK
ncbi:MAG: hypothetical protein J1E59_09715 [Treponema sp.]|nr:hypothetical protein [Treponema sp.]